LDLLNFSLSILDKSTKFKNISFLDFIQKYKNLDKQVGHSILFYFAFIVKRFSSNASQFWQNNSLVILNDLRKFSSRRIYHKKFIPNKLSPRSFDKIKYLIFKQKRRMPRKKQMPEDLNRSFFANLVKHMLFLFKDDITNLKRKIGIKQKYTSLFQSLASDSLKEYLLDQSKKAPVEEEDENALFARFLATQKGGVIDFEQMQSFARNEFEKKKNLHL